MSLTPLELNQESDEFDKVLTKQLKIQERTQTKQQSVVAKTSQKQERIQQGVSPYLQEGDNTLSMPNFNQVGNDSDSGYYTNQDGVTAPIRLMGIDSFESSPYKDESSVRIQQKQYLSTQTGVPLEDITDDMIYRLGKRANTAYQQEFARGQGDYDAETGKVSRTEDGVYGVYDPIVTASYDPTTMKYAGDKRTKATLTNPYTGQNLAKYMNDPRYNTRWLDDNPEQNKVRQIYEAINGTDYSSLFDLEHTTNQQGQEVEDTRSFWDKVGDLYEANAIEEAGLLKAGLASVQDTVGFDGASTENLAEAAEAMKRAEELRGDADVEYKNIMHPSTWSWEGLENTTADIIGNVGYELTQAAAITGVSALAGTTVGPIGSVAGAGVGISAAIAKYGAKQITKDLVKNYIKNDVKKLGKKTIKALRTKRALGTNIALNVGYSTAVAQGSNYFDVTKDNPELRGEWKTLGGTLVGSVAEGMLDAVMPVDINMRVLKKFGFEKAASGNIIKNIKAQAAKQFFKGASAQAGKQMLRTSGIEGVTEALQEVIGETTKNLVKSGKLPDYQEEEFIDNMLNAFFGGIFIGGGMSVTVSSPSLIKAAIPKSADQKRNIKATQDYAEATVENAKQEQEFEKNNKITRATAKQEIKDVQAVNDGLDSLGRDEKTKTEDEAAIEIKGHQAVFIGKVDEAQAELINEISASVTSDTKLPKDLGKRVRKLAELSKQINKLPSSGAIENAEADVQAQKQQAVTKYSEQLLKQTNDLATKKITREEYGKGIKELREEYVKSADIAQQSNSVLQKRKVNNQKSFEKLAKLKTQVDTSIEKQQEVSTEVLKPLYSKLKENEEALTKLEERKSSLQKDRLVHKYEKSVENINKQIKRIERKHDKVGTGKGAVGLAELKSRSEGLEIAIKQIVAQPGNEAHQQETKDEPEAKRKGEVFKNTAEEQETKEPTIKNTGKTQGELNKAKRENLAKHVTLGEVHPTITAIKENKEDPEKQLKTFAELTGFKEDSIENKNFTKKFNKVYESLSSLNETTPYSAPRIPVLEEHLQAALGKEQLVLFSEFEGDKLKLTEDALVAGSLALIDFHSNYKNSSQGLNSPSVLQFYGIQKYEKHRVTPKQWTALGNLGMKDERAFSTIGDTALEFLGGVTKSKESPLIKQEVQAFSKALGAALVHMSSNPQNKSGVQLKVESTKIPDDVMFLRNSGKSTRVGLTHLKSVKVVLTPSEEANRGRFARDRDREVTLKAITNAKNFGSESPLKLKGMDVITDPKTQNKVTGTDINKITSKELGKVAEIASETILKPIDPLMRTLYKLGQNENIEGKKDPRLSLLFNEMLGIESTEGLSVLKTKGIKVANQGRIEEANNVMTYMTTFGEGARHQQKFKHQSQDRLSNISQLINGQRSKLHRALFNIDGAEMSINPAETSIEDRANAYLFKTAVSQALGAKVEKVTSPKIIEFFETALKDKDLIAIGSTINKGKIPVNAITNYKKKADVIGFTFSPTNIIGVVELAKYADSLKKGEVFNSDIAMEVDGTTNGFAISLTSFMNDAAVGTENAHYPTQNEFDTALGEYLKKVGVFDDEVSFLSHYMDGDKTDTYEESISTAVSEIKKSRESDKEIDLKFEALENLTSPLAKEEGGVSKITKFGRNLVKTPMTAVTYGQSIISARNAMIDTLLLEIPDTFAKLQHAYNSANEQQKGSILKETKAQLTSFKYLFPKITTKSAEALLKGNTGDKLFAEEVFGDYTLNEREYAYATNVLRKLVGKPLSTGMESVHELINETTTALVKVNTIHTDRVIILKNIYNNQAVLGKVFSSNKFGFNEDNTKYKVDLSFIKLTKGVDFAKTLELDSKKDQDVIAEIQNIVENINDLSFLAEENNTMAVVLFIEEYSKSKDVQLRVLSRLLDNTLKGDNLLNNITPGNSFEQKGHTLDSKNLDTINKMLQTNNLLPSTKSLVTGKQITLIKHKAITGKIKGHLSADKERLGLYNSTYTSVDAKGNFARSNEKVYKRTAKNPIHNIEVSTKDIEFTGAGAAILARTVQNVDAFALAHAVVATGGNIQLLHDAGYAPIKHIATMEKGFNSGFSKIYSKEKGGSVLEIYIKALKKNAETFDKAVSPLLLGIIEGTNRERISKFNDTVTANQIIHNVTSTRAQKGSAERLIQSIQQDTRDFDVFGGQTLLPESYAEALANIITANEQVKVTQQRMGMQDKKATHQYPLQPLVQKIGQATEEITDIVMKANASSTDDVFDSIALQTKTNFKDNFANLVSEAQKQDQVTGKFDTAESKRLGGIQKELTSLIGLMDDTTIETYRTNNPKVTGEIYLEKKEGKQNTVKLGIPTSPVSHSSQSQEEVLTHETLHPLISFTTSSFKNREKLMKYRNIAKKAVDDEYKGKGYELFLAKDEQGNILTTHYNEATEIAHAKAQYAHIFAETNSSTISSENTDNSLDEFLNYALTNRKLAPFLETISMKDTKADRKDKGLLEKIFLVIIDAIKSIANLMRHKRVPKNMQSALNIMLKNEARLQNKQAQLAALNKHKYEKAVRDRKLAEATTLYIQGKDKGKTFINEIAIRVREIVGDSKDRGLIKETANLLATIYIYSGAKVLSVGSRIALQKLRNSAMIKLLSPVINPITDLIGSIVNNEILGKTSKEVVDLVLKRNKHLDAAMNTQKDNAIALLKENFNSGYDKFSKTEKESLTYLMMSDVSSLLKTFSDEVTISALQDENTRLELISTITKELGLKGNKELDKSISGLSHFIVTREVIQGNNKFYRNATAMLKAYGKKNSTLTDKEFTNKIEAIVALKAYGELSQGHQSNISGIVKKEGGDLEMNGVMLMLKSHNGFKEESKEKNFKNAEMLQEIGHISILVDPNTNMISKPFTKENDEFLIDSGFRRVIETGGKQHRVGFYIRKNDPETGRVKGIFSIQDNRHKGTSLKDRLKSEDKSSAEIQKIIGDMKGDEGYTALPLYNSKGKIIDYTYQMSYENLINDVGVDMEVATIWGKMNAGIVAKANSDEINDSALDYLHEVQENLSDTEKLKYTNILAEENKHILERLPEDIKKRMEGRGEKALVKKKELNPHLEAEPEFFLNTVDINPILGYKKASLSNIFIPKLWSMYKGKGLQEGQFTDKEVISSSKVTKTIKRLEKVIQSAVSFAIVSIIVKFPAVQTWNVTSNLITNMVKGVPLPYALDKYEEGVVAFKSFNKTVRDVYKLEQELNFTKDAKKLSEIRRKLAIHKRALEKNPIAPLIDAGLYSAIAEDIHQGAGDLQNKFSHKITKKSEQYLGSTITKVGKELFLAEDTKNFKFLLDGLRIGDLLARYAEYEYRTKVVKADKASVMTDIRDTFVVYELPMNKYLQYAGDFGFVWFLKYYLRSQKQAVKRAKSNPLNFAAFLATQGILDIDFPSIFDASALTGNTPYFGTPFNAVDELINIPILDAVMGENNWLMRI